ncbi:hypothetical protein ACFLSQ_06825 [Bacteroidota bacterium]
MKYINIIILLLFITLNSCSIIENIAGVGFDPEQFAKAREAKIMELRLKSALDLKKRLSTSEPLDNADITIFLNETLVNKLLDQYESATGMLDKSTNYLIKDIKLELLSGSAIASIRLFAHNDEHNIDLELMLDCFLTIEPADKDLALRLEPFNIMPVLTTRGLYSAAKSTINKMIKLNLADLGKKLPPIKIPVNIENKIPVKGSKTDIKSKINISIVNPDRQLSYKLKIKEILFFENKIFIALNLDRIEVN